MRTLYIDLAGAERAFLLLDGGACVGRKDVEDHKAEDRLLPAIDALLQEAKWDRRDIGRIAVVTGPGGFMTIRVAVSLANAMGYALKVPLAGAHLSDVWQARVKEKDWVWLHSTKKTHAFIRGFGKYANMWPEAALTAVADLQAVAAGTPWAGELIPEHAAALPGLVALRQLKTLEQAAPVVADGLSYGEKTLLPWYGRGA